MLGTSDRQLYGAMVKPHRAPVTAMALAEADVYGFAVTEDRGGTVVVSRIDQNGLDPRPLHRIRLNSTVLSSRR